MKKQGGNAEGEGNRTDTVFFADFGNFTFQMENQQVVLTELKQSKLKVFARYG